MMKSDTKTMFFVLFVAKNGKMIIPSTHPAMPPGAPPQPSPRGVSSFLLCLRRFDDVFSPWERLGWGFYWCALPLRRVGEWGSKKQPSVIVITLGCFLVPRAGVEPARIAPLVFETSASTDSAIWAIAGAKAVSYTHLTLPTR